MSIESFADAVKHGFYLAVREAGLFRNFRYRIQVPVPAEKDIALHVIQRFQEIVQTGQDFPANGFFFGTYLAADTIPEFLQGNLHLTAATFEGSVLPPAIQGNIPSNFS